MATPVNDCMLFCCHQRTGAQTGRKNTCSFKCKFNRSTENKMNHKKMYLLVTGLVLPSLRLAECGAESPGAAGFPTGKFVWKGIDLKEVNLTKIRPGPLSTMVKMWTKGPIVSKVIFIHRK